MQWKCNIIVTLTVLFASIFKSDIYVINLFKVQRAITAYAANRHFKSDVCLNLQCCIFPLRSDHMHTEQGTQIIEYEQGDLVADDTCLMI